MGFKRKAVSINWELMFTRAIFQTPDMDAQGNLLNEVARLIDAGRIRTTLSQVLSPINVANLKQAHALIETGHSKGKIVLEGF
jgi:NADPH:quinone reductase-like Zn-dependent oxidoreductase